MSNYLETIYFRDEYAETAYPQKLCDYVLDTIIRPAVGETCRLLDIGSGKGNHLVAFKRRGLDVCGLDKRQECVEALKDIEIRECDIENDLFPFKENSFDVVFSKSVIEHVVNADNVLAQAYRVVKPGGIVILMTPDWRSQRAFFWDDYTHVKAWTRKGLQDALVMFGFEKVDCRLFRQLPLVWKYPLMNMLADVTSLLPDSLKWKDREEKQFRRWIRFSKEKMLLAVGKKPHV